MLYNIIFIVRTLRRIGWELVWHESMLPGVEFMSYMENYLIFLNCLNRNRLNWL